MTQLSEGRRWPTRFEWIGEQEIFEGPKTYKTPDGEFHESISVTYHKAPMSGFPVNTLVIHYSGEEPQLESARSVTLENVRPWLERWGYR
jgi:hypothetical protein